MADLLPDKFTRAENTIAGQAAAILGLLEESESVASLYVRARQGRLEITYDAFSAALCFLYAAGLVDYRDGFMTRSF